MLISIKTEPCIICGDVSRVSVFQDDFYRWQGSYDTPGVLIQEAFPYLDADQRELLMTGTHPQCWNEFIDEVEDHANGDGQRV